MTFRASRYISKVTSYRNPSLDSYSATDLNPVWHAYGVEYENDSLQVEEFTITDIKTYSVQSVDKTTRGKKNKILTNSMHVIF